MYINFIKPLDVFFSPAMFRESSNALVLVYMFLRRQDGSVLDVYDQYILYELSLPWNLDMKEI